MVRQKLRILDSEFDVAAHYRQLLPAAAGALELRAAIGALGECGAEDDVLLLEPYAADTRPKVRAAAVNAMALLDRDSVGFLLDALVDPSRRVSRAAARILERRPRAELDGRLAAIVESELAPEHARRSALDILCVATCWVRLERLLRLTASTNEQAAGWARARVPEHGWLPLTNTEAEAIERALTVATLSPGDREFVRREMDLWRRKT